MVYEKILKMAKEEIISKPALEEPKPIELSGRGKLIPKV